MKDVLAYIQRKLGIGSKWIQWTQLERNERYNFETETTDVSYTLSGRYNNDLIARLVVEPPDIIETYYYNDIPVYVTVEVIE